MAVVSANLHADPPGLVYAAELRQQLSAGLQSLGPDYRPRTEHLHADGQPEFTNRLVLEDSPYLRQHAHNPVDWHAWGPEAFESARRQDKPVFLSIGYSTCHWCHVMERESFESLEVAEYLNTHFISIKVDREQRPDIDEIYMTGVQIISGHGGWPMSSFLTPEARTFFGGTYYPQVQFLALLQQVTKVWKEDCAGINAQADKVTDAVQRHLDQAREAGTLSAGAAELAVTQLRQRHDSAHGGFSPAPKFPNEANYLFLIDFALRHPDQELSELIRFDLQTMARGGIYDQVGGGFHRYSTDDDWLVPHFEKMLYNQAQLTRTYLDAARLTGEPEFARVARQILDYVLRDMTAPQGGFYSATDADSEGGEGLFFLWTPAQVQALLSEDDAELAIRLFQLTTSGNFEGSNIPHLSAAAEVLAAAENMSPDAFLEKVEQIREQLYHARELREQPGLDDKIITSWTGMMIMALAQAGHTADGERYANAAIKAGEYLWHKHRDGAGHLYRASLDGRASVPGVQEDYAWLADAFISLYDLSQEARWLKRARQLIETMQSLFWDETSGGYFMSIAGGGEPAATPIMGRPKDLNDGATPSGNAVALHALARLARRPAGKDEYFLANTRANALQSTFAQAINQHPAAFTYLLRAARIHRSGESGALNYAAHGALRIDAHTETDAGGLELVVELRIQPGWHVNAHEPLSADLVPTVLQMAEDDSAWKLAEVNYPEPTTKALGFQSEDLALYESSVRLSARLTPLDGNSSRLLRVKLGLQACDDRICLPPEDVFLQVPIR